MDTEHNHTINNRPNNQGQKPANLESQQPANSGQSSNQWDADSSKYDWGFFKGNEEPTLFPLARTR